MRAFLLRRALHAVFVLWGVVTAVFFLVRLTGDPTPFLVDQTATQQEIAEARRSLGLDRPLHVQYLEFLRAVPHGDFGASIREKRPAMQMVLESLWPATVELAAAALLLSTVLAIPLGVASATHKNGAVDHASRVASLFLQSMPSFWLGLMLILLFAVELGGLLPAFGSGSFRHLILPAVTLAAAPLAQNVRLIRSGMLEVLQQDYVRTARAKGLADGRVIWRHALRNALIPVVTVVGLSLPVLVGGAVLTETVFAWPGIGRLAVGAVFERDYPVIMGVNLMIAAVVIGANLLTDIAYCLIDPRIAYR